MPREERAVAVGRAGGRPASSANRNELPSDASVAAQMKEEPYWLGLTRVPERQAARISATAIVCATRAFLAEPLVIRAGSLILHHCPSQSRPDEKNQAGVIISSLSDSEWRVDVRLLFQREAVLRVSHAGFGPFEGVSVGGAVRHSARRCDAWPLLGPRRIVVRVDIASQKETVVRDVAFLRQKADLACFGAPQRAPAQARYFG
jgi:hypothetical protein